MPPVAGTQPCLVVDDEEYNRDLLARLLRRHSRVVYLAGDGEEGLRILEQHPVAIILADHRMPKLLGTELLERASELQPEAIRVLVTAHGDTETLTQAINTSHVFQVVPKPITPELMDVVVMRALEAHEAAARERALFDAFVKAAVNAIEQRDPSTAGHSSRVAAMTTRLAAEVDAVTEGPLAEVHFGRDAVELIRYACLLHDLGKIGVREMVLLKARKLPDARRELIEHRIRDRVEFGRLTREEGSRLLLALATLDQPDVDLTAHAEDLAALERTGLLSSSDARYLRIPRGTLSADERVEAQSHVLGSVRFLREIPWPERLARIVDITAAHHEMPSGRGYPRGATDIPIEARMMAVCDVYDALGAADRPYKLALTHERAAQVMRGLAAQGVLDAELVELFLSRDVSRALLPR